MYNVEKEKGKKRRRRDEEKNNDQRCGSYWVLLK